MKLTDTAKLVLSESIGKRFYYTGSNGTLGYFPVGDKVKVHHHGYDGVDHNDDWSVESKDESDMSQGGWYRCVHHVKEGHPSAYDPENGEPGDRKLSILRSGFEMTKANPEVK